MSIDALHWAIHENRLPSPTVKLVLLMMANDADGDHTVLMEPHLFASSCCLSLDELKVALRSLLDRGLIEHVKDDGRKRRQTQIVYRLQGYDA